MAKKRSPIVAVESIEQAIYRIRGQKVILDEDLAELYEVPTGRLNEAVTRNIERFPGDFVFRLTSEEFANLKSQSATSSWGGRRKPPRAFTEQGVAMLSGVLRSTRAIQVNVEIMRAFVRLRELLTTHRGLAAKLDSLEEKYDRRFRVVFEAIRKLMEPPPTSKKRIGFGR